MKTLYPFIIFALSLSISQNAFSNDNVITSIAALCEETISENEYLEYKFGFSKIVTVKVVRRFDNYIISIYSEDRKSNKELVIRDSDILDWAFEKMPQELGRTRYTFDESYSPAVTELTFVNKLNGLNLCITSRMVIIGDEELKNYLNKLKSYLVNIWYSEVFLLG